MVVIFNRSFTIIHLGCQLIYPRHLAQRKHHYYLQVSILSGVNLVMEKG